MADEVEEPGESEELIIGCFVVKGVIEQIDTRNSSYIYYAGTSEPRGTLFVRETLDEAWRIPTRQEAERIHKKLRIMKPAYTWTIEELDEDTEGEPIVMEAQPLAAVKSITSKSETMEEKLKRLVNISRQLNPTAAAEKLVGMYFMSRMIAAGRTPWPRILGGNIIEFVGNQSFLIHNIVIHGEGAGEEFYAVAHVFDLVKGYRLYYSKEELAAALVSAVNSELVPTRKKR